MKEKQLIKLYDSVRDEEVSVVRGQYGLSQPCKVLDLVVGDIILVETGMRIPADCILIDGMDIVCDESIYNEDRELLAPKMISKGEEHHRENPDPFLLSRSLVVSGSGRAVVCSVGKYTRFSQQFPEEDLPEEQNLTPLQERLEKLAGIFGKFGYFAGMIVFLTMTVFLIIYNMVTDTGEWLTIATLMKILQMFTIAIAIVIVAVPEGLPLAVSIAMAFSVDEMKRDNLLVKKQEACETLGYIKEICTGKTATLTKNDMSVKQFYTVQRTFENHGKALTQAGLENKVVEIIQDCIILNNDSKVEMSENARYVPEGNGTEIAMLKFL